MTNDRGGLDARPFQLELLKFETRVLRPLAKTLLDANASRTAKRTALALTAAIAVSMQPTSKAYANLVGIERADAGAAEAIEHFVERCKDIDGLIEIGAAETSLFDELVALFRVVEDEHARLEAIAKTASARLLGGDVGPQATGTGRKDPPSAWLMRVFSPFGR